MARTIKLFISQPMNGKTDKEILTIYKERREIYRQINQAILSQNISFLQENVALIASIPCYNWCLSYYSLKANEIDQNQAGLTRKKEN